MTSPQLQAIAAVGGDPRKVRSVDPFGAVCFMDGTGRLRKAHRDGRVWDYDSSTWRQVLPRG